jgi:hypothetical protein
VSCAPYFSQRAIAARTRFLRSAIFWKVAGTLFIELKGLLRLPAIRDVLSKDEDADDIPGWVAIGNLIRLDPSFSSGGRLI